MRVCDMGAVEALYGSIARRKRKPVADDGDGQAVI
jgi:hypothetical protein